MVGLASISLNRSSSFLILYLLFTQALTPVSAGDTLSILSQNMNRLFDDIASGSEKVESPQRYAERTALAASKFLYQYDSPEIIALQEVENIIVLQAIADRIQKSGGPKYHAVLFEGNDLSGIDVGFLVDASLQIRQKKQLFKHRRLPPKFSPLFSRPPLLIEVCRSECLTLINVHLRSMRGLRSAGKGRRVALKRRAQADELAIWIDHFQHSNPAQFLLVAGDLNALQPADKYVDVVGHLIGNPDNEGRRFTSKDRIKNDLENLTLRISPSNRYSYLYKGKKQILDYMLASRNFSQRLKSIRFGSIDRDFSDHAGLLAEFSW